MNSKMRSCVMGLILGQFSSPLPEVQKEPVAYLYNGVRLPKLPEWDKETSPYVYMHSDLVLNRRYIRVLSNLNFLVNSDGLWGLSHYPKYLQCYCFVPTGKWSEWEEQEGAESGGMSVSKIAWANFDVPNEDGTVRLEASEPIPVYE